MTAPRLFNTDGKPRGQPSDTAMRVHDLWRGGLSYAEIAERLGIKRGTVERYVTAAREAVRDRLSR